jgi:hypothetical protein
MSHHKVPLLNQRRLGNPQTTQLGRVRVAIKCPVCAVGLQRRRPGPGTLPASSSSSLSLASCRASNCRSGHSAMRMLPSGPITGNTRNLNSFILDIGSCRTIRFPSSTSAVWVTSNPRSFAVHASRHRVSRRRRRAATPSPGVRGHCRNPPWGRSQGIRGNLTLSIWI